MGIKSLVLTKGVIIGKIREENLVERGGVRSFERIEVVRAEVKKDEVDRSLDEWAEVVYLSLCQLPRNQIDGSSISIPLAWEKEDARAA